MMDHQQTAVEKLSRVKVGALYMDMGTGKTRTALELAVRRMQAGKCDCILWLCPVSVRRTIADEVTKHLAGAVVEMVRPNRVCGQADIYIAGIESLSGSLSLNVRLLELVQAKRCFLVCDESSLIKNRHADRTVAVWRLAERCRYRLILNGTPLSNNERDLYSQWYVLDWRILGYSSFYSFAANHLEYDRDIPGRIVAAHDVDLLVRKMQPYLYQVRKSDCLDLPEKTYSRYYTGMSAKQFILYHETKAELLFDLDPNEDNSTAIYKLFTALQRIVSGVDLEGKPLFAPGYNPRLQLLDEIIEDIPGDAKVIIWCKYTHEVEAVAASLGGGVSRLYGELTPKQRDAELAAFAGPNRFLVANKSLGAFGLNLQFARYAIFYDNDFSWATRAQAEDRIHRAGQTQQTHYVDIVCSGSIDDRIQQCLQRKGDLVEDFRAEIKRTGNNLGRWLDGENIPDDGCAPGSDPAAGEGVRRVRKGVFKFQRGEGLQRDA